MSSLGDLSVSAYLERVASADPTPGGGSVAALVAALAAALGSMATVLSLPKSQSEGLPKLAEQCAALRGTFLRLSAEDEAAFQSVMESLRLPRNAPSRATELESAIQRAAEVPLDLCQACIELLSILEPLVDLSSRHSVSDIGVAAHLALAALRSSRLNVEINLTFMTDREAAMRIEAISRQVEEEGSERCQRIQEGVLHRIRE